MTSTHSEVKVSEGIDFTDRQARAVVVCGIPFPPIADVRVSLKQLYLTDANRRAPTEKIMSPNDWYKLEAVRSVNQAIGRVIRHADDFGAIILADARFGYWPKSMFPAWMAASYQIFNQSIGQALPALSNFFHQHKHKLNRDLGKLSDTTVEKPITASQWQPKKRSAISEYVPDCQGNRTNICSQQSSSAEHSSSAQPAVRNGASSSCCASGLAVKRSKSCAAPVNILSALEADFEANFEADESESRPSTSEMASRDLDEANNQMLFVASTTSCATVNRRKIKLKQTTLATLQEPNKEIKLPVKSEADKPKSVAEAADTPAKQFFIKFRQTFGSAESKSFSVVVGRYNKVKDYADLEKNLKRLLWSKPELKTYLGLLSNCMIFPEHQKRFERLLASL